MKNLIILPLLLVLLATSAFSKKSVPSPAFRPGINNTTVLAGFDFFRTHRQGKDGITSTWGYTGAVTGFVVERTYEDPADPYAYWETVAIVPASGLRSYKTTEVNVTPGFISYRVKAMNGTSIVTVSDISTEHIVSH
jgi:hypothetical protein